MMFMESKLTGWEAKMFSGVNIHKSQLFGGEPRGIRLLTPYQHSSGWRVSCSEIAWDYLISVYDGFWFPPIDVSLLEGTTDKHWQTYGDLDRKRIDTMMGVSLIFGLLWVYVNWHPGALHWLHFMTVLMMPGWFYDCITLWEHVFNVPRRGWLQHIQAGRFETWGTIPACSKP